jgi:multicomponent Na+:H+ antiporter subunit B
MSSLILRTIAPVLTILTIAFSIFVLLRGHNEPGGGFIGGLIAASGFALYSMAFGVGATRRSLVVHPISYAGFGLVLAIISGLLSYGFEMPFLTGLWYIPEFDDHFKLIATPVLFDLGVYLVVVGVVTTLVLELETED